MSLINFTAAEIGYLTLLAFLSILYVAVALVYVFYIRRRWAYMCFTLEMALSILIIAAILVSCMFAIGYGSQPWTFILPNGTVVTLSHSDSYTSMYNAVSTAAMLTAIFSVMVIVVALLIDLIYMWSGRKAP